MAGGLSHKLLAGIFVLFVLAGPLLAATIHVKADATGTNNGTNWTDAFTLLQPAEKLGEAVDHLGLGLVANGLISDEILDVAEADGLYIAVAPAIGGQPQPISEVALVRGAAVFGGEPALGLSFE